MPTSRRAPSRRGRQAAAAAVATKTTKRSRSKKSTKLSVPSANLRVLSVNACCLPSGMRNANLPSDTIRSGFLLHFLIFGLSLLFYHTQYSEVDIQSTSFLARVALPLFLACFLPGWMFGGHAARATGGLRQLLCGWGSDHKFKRLKVLSEDVLSQYDVVAIQELFGSIPTVIDGGHVDYLISYAAKQGLIHVSRPSGPQFPSFGMDTGLLILSRFPIEEFTSLSFSHQFVGEQFAVNRGAMHAKIQLPREYDSYTEGKPLHFFTAHVSPSMRKLLDGYPETLIQMGENARNAQFQQLGDFIASRWNESVGGGGGRCIVAGDFNADVKYPTSTPQNKKHNIPVPGPAMSTVLETLVDHCGLNDTANGKYVPTFGYMGNEQLLTNTGQRYTYKTDDLIFCDDGTKNKFNKFDWTCVSMEVGDTCCTDGDGDDDRKEESLPFTHLSDHWGVSIICPKVAWKSGEKTR